MKTLLIDAGNSHLKWAILSENQNRLENGRELSKQQSISHKFELPIEVFEKIVTESQDCNSVLIVSVLGETFSSAAKKIARKHSMEFVEVTSQEELGNIKNGYKDPSKLGADRFVGIIAAYHLQNSSSVEKQACIVVDSGTATTIDAVDKNGKHLGGVILPGLYLCSDSLLENTELLGLWGNEDKTFTPQCFAKETTQAIASGCLLGHAGAIEHICNMMEQDLIKETTEVNDTDGEVKRVICGGAAESLLPYMANDYDLQDNLLMLGLKVIMEDTTNNV